MKIDAYICDGCNRLRKCTTFRENMGKEMDPSGNGYNINWKYYDICKDCVECFMLQHPSAVKNTLK